MTAGPFKALISFHYYRLTDVGELHDAFGGNIMLFGDSGAFSAQTQGAKISLEDYAAWLHRWGKQLTVYASLDVIGDDPASIKNLRELERQGLRPLPVFHAGSNFKTLEAYCEQYPYVALGGMVGKPQLGPWLVRCFKIAAKHGAVFHGFGQTRREFMMDFPFYSVDSSSWTNGVRFGIITLWDERAGRLVKAQVGDHRSVYRVAELIRLHGGDPAKLSNRADYHRDHIIPVNGMAWMRYGEFLRRRHGPVRLRDDTAAAGPHLYLAEGSYDNVVSAAAGLHLYLADTATRNFRPMALQQKEPA